MTAYAFEFFRTADGIFPCCVTDSELAGHLAVVYGAYHLQRHLGGRGVLLCHLPGLAPPKVVIIGHGNAGGAAARTALALGAEVVVFGRDPDRLRQFQGRVSPRLKCCVVARAALEREIPDADLVAGVILISSYDTPPMIDPSLVARLKPGAVLVDVTCGYGPGYLPTFDRETSHDDAAYVVHGVTHIKIGALPATIPVTASALASATLGPYLIDLTCARREGVVEPPVIAAGKIVEDGRVVHPEVRRQLDLQRGWAVSR